MGPLIIQHKTRRILINTSENTDHESVHFIRILNTFVTESFISQADYVRGENEKKTITNNYSVSHRRIFPYAQNIKYFHLDHLFKLISSILQDYSILTNTDVFIIPLYLKKINLKEMSASILISPQQLEILSVV